MIIKSANDAAAAMAEALGGSESGFARLMTQKAREIGMRRTVFMNASGLPNMQQVTTARDMSTLAVALINNYPRNTGCSRRPASLTAASAFAATTI